jgi:phosphopantothenoylcysteine decarboxylase/phosphopantothenate--cysteine ligase
VPYATVHRVESAAEMTAAVSELAPGADALVSAAAISDYTVEEADEKIRSGQDSLTLELEPTPKLIDTVRAEHPDLPIVGFKVESSGGDDDLLAHSRDLLARVDLTFVVANAASVMGDAGTRALLVEAEDHEVYTGDKQGLGLTVAKKIGEKLGG